MSMARLWCAIIVFVAGFSLLIVNATPSAKLVKRNAQPGKQNEDHFQQVAVEEELGDQTRRKKRGSQARSYCEQETHVHFRTRCCSGKSVNNPLLQTCCAGQIVPKNMVAVFCHPLYGCSKFWYSVNSDKCCYGSKTSVCKDVDPACGLATYNASTQRCCDGRYVYYVINQMCCHRRVISRSKACS